VSECQCAIQSISHGRVDSCVRTNPYIGPALKTCKRAGLVNYSFNCASQDSEEWTTLHDPSKTKTPNGWQLAPVRSMSAKGGPWMAKANPRIRMCVTLECQSAQVPPRAATPLCFTGRGILLMPMHLVVWSVAPHIQPPIRSFEFPQYWHCHVTCQLAQCNLLTC